MTHGEMQFMPGFVISGVTGEKGVSKYTVHAAADVFVGAMVIITILVGVGTGKAAIFRPAAQLFIDMHKHCIIIWRRIGGYERILSVKGAIDR